MKTMHQPCLRVENDLPSTLVISLDSHLYLPPWEELKKQVVECAFAKRDIFFVTPHPPIWDLELGELSQDVTFVQTGGKSMGTLSIAKAPSVSIEALSNAVSSTDFTLRDLRLVAVPLDSDKRIRDFALKLFEADPLGSIDTSEEYMECIDDKWIYWYHPNEKHSTMCLKMLNQWAKNEGGYITHG